ncbi:MAG: hypothetical protein M1837_003749 [Sclerophora amabilis]|nr:MAG: hypothetical protein M1837_003749 [Sclerophora amabilis]
MASYSQRMLDRITMALKAATKGTEGCLIDLSAEGDGVNRGGGSRKVPLLQAALTGRTENAASLMGLEITPTSTPTASEGKSGSPNLTSTAQTRSPTEGGEAFEMRRVPTVRGPASADGIRDASGPGRGLAYIRYFQSAVANDAQPLERVLTHQDHWGTPSKPPAGGKPEGTRPKIPTISEKAGLTALLPLETAEPKSPGIFGLDHSTVRATSLFDVSPNDDEPLKLQNANSEVESVHPKNGTAQTPKTPTKYCNPVDDSRTLSWDEKLGKRAVDSHSVESSPTHAQASGTRHPQRERIQVPAAGKCNEAAEYPPGISFLGLAPHATVRALLSLVRIPNGRIRLVLYGARPREKKIYFAEWAAHEEFMDRARQGRLRSPWTFAFTLEVDAEDYLQPVGEEAVPGATRVLQIDTSSQGGFTIDSVLDDIAAACNGLQYFIEKVLLLRGDAGPTSRVIKINFTSIRDAVRARQTLENIPRLASIYRDASISFGWDECSSSVSFQSPAHGPQQILDLRSGTSNAPNKPASPGDLIRLPFRSPLVQGCHRPSKTPLSPRKSRGLPQIGQAPLSPPISPQVGQIPPNAPQLAQNSQRQGLQVNKRISRPPASPQKPYYLEEPHAKGFAYPPYGIYIIELPTSITFATLLSSVRGGRVYQCYIFRMKGQDSSSFHTDAAVFFTTKEERASVMSRLSHKKGLLVPHTSKEQAKRYQVRRFDRTSPSSTVSPLPDGASRCISITVDNVPSNSDCNPGSVWNYIFKRCKVFSELEKNRETLSAGKKRIEIFLTSIPAAMQAKKELEALKVGGAKPVITFEKDPCTGPVTEML